MKARLRIPTAAGVTSWLLVVFLVLFPKGGIKTGGIPVTWGYVFLGLSFFPLLIIRLLNFPLRASRTTLAVFACILPFQVVLVYSFYVNGFLSPAFAVAIITTLIFLPALFLGIFPPFLRFVGYNRFSRTFCFCVLAAAVWGIFLFIYHPITGHFIEIPYFTVNAGDYGELENTKNIARGPYLKLISTYNNGNVYGVATLILLPLYIRLEPRRWKHRIVRLALVLTLSRTVWLGLVLEQGLSLVVKLPHVLARFPRVRPHVAKTQLIAVGGAVALVLSVLILSGKNLAYIFASGLGGRETELAGFTDPTLLPGVPVTAFNELVYASALQFYGVAGFFAVMLLFASPVLLILWKPHLVGTPTGRAAAKGLILYAAVASIDGAILLIPVMAFYWFVYMTFLHGLPGERIPAHRPLAQASAAAPSGSPGYSAPGSLPLPT